MTALTNDRAVGSAHDLRAWLDAAAELARAVNRGLGPAEVASLAAGTVVHLTGYDFCSLFVPDETGRHLVILGSYGLSVEYVTRVNAERPPRITPGATAEGPTSRAYRSQRPVALVDICADPTCSEWEAAAAQEGYRAILALPLTGVGGVLGVISCYSRPPRDVPADEVVLMETFANQVALTMEAAIRRERGRTENARLRARVAELEERHRVEERAERVHRALLRLLLAGEPLARVIEHLARELGADVVVEDADGNRLAATADRHCPAGAAPPAHRASDEYRAVPIDGENGLVAPIVLAGELAGRVWVFDLQDPGAAWQRRVLERGASVVALAVSKMCTAQEVEWRLSREFLDELLTAPAVDPPAAVSRARHFGVDLALPHTLLVVRPDPGVDQASNGNRSLLTQVQHVVNATAAEALVAARGGDVIVLWPHRPGLPDARDIAERLRGHCTSCSPGTVSVGLGRACENVTEYADAYRLAVGALNLTQRAGGTDRVVALGDLGIYRLLLQVERPDELIEFMQQILDPLRSYDRRRDTTLVETLRAFMRCGCNATVTAEALIVHPNTISYRLHRIEEILGVDLHDPQALLRIQLAFVVDDVLGAGT
ncbi:GAF domain-containing protein [Pseudonocardia thermophila]|uniref:GAF domain-containing protein n=1 Tax=Pseudonocardia thermophila TaxID=1848 RepID=A0A1M6TPX0_PSETH|nr:helix-turn-helix domain-containing protein [Pseudonocardia thermophila]SHK58960.1 GAF domain-containing protein [Pseudonocardia thermophila]